MWCALRRGAGGYTTGMSFRDELAQRFSGDIENTPEVLESYSRDASLYHMTPELVVFPRDEGDIQTLVHCARAAKEAGEQVSLTARAAGTDMSGGPLSNSVVVSMTRYLNRIHEIDESSAVVEPGVYFRDFDKETKMHGLELPSYTASRELCAIGGMVANNSGGEKHLKFGKTARYVDALDVVLDDGSVAHFERVEGEALTAKLALQTREGELYRQMSNLVQEHEETITQARPKVRKNSSGYALWDIGSADKGWMNLARLFVGAQGTLGIFTKVHLSLVKPQPYGAMVVIFLNELRELGDITQSVLTHNPDSFESYDDHTFSLGIRYFPQLALQMKTGLIRLGFSLIPEFIMALTGGVPKMVLLAEFRAETQEDANYAAHAARDAVALKHPGMSVRVIEGDAGMQKYWSIRRESFNLLRKRIRGKRTAPFIDDFVVPPMSLPEFLPKLNAILKTAEGMTYTVAGHIGDGNLHIIPLIDPTRPDAVDLIQRLSKEVYTLVLSYNGSITGEHNDGLVRTPFVRDMFGEQMYALFEETKRIFDPLNIFNPGKKVGLTFDEAKHHLDVGAAKNLPR